MNEMFEEYTKNKIEIKPYFETELSTIYNSPMLKILKQMKDKSIDLIFADPPYGIAASKGTNGFGDSKETVKKYDDDWDSKPPSQEEFNEMLRVGKKVLIFGGNYFTDKLPVNGH